MNNLYRKSLVTVETLKKEDIEAIFTKASQAKKLVLDKGGDESLKGKIMAALFYEPSSRTIASFLSAMQRLGGGIIPIHGMNFTSVAKGESQIDTIRTFSSFSEIIIIRTAQIGAAKIAADFATIPVINAGDGTGEHPTQALLDAYTIKNHFASFAGLTVGMVGDMLNGRTVHSLSKLLTILGVKKFFFVSPTQLNMPQEINDYIQKAGGQVNETETIENVLESLDVLYVTRVQKERFKDLSEYERLKLAYIITPEVLTKAKKSMIIMHPLPRVGEITYEVDSDPRAVYLNEQMRNGLYIRMALLELILKE